MTDRIYYAIGDVHGESARLGELHRAIREDAAQRTDPATVVHLGDLIDRGPDSRGVIARCRALHAMTNDRFEVITLRGNHEQMLLDADASRDRNDIAHWLINGGDTALASYGSRGGASDQMDLIPRDEIAWLQSLPIFHHDQARRIFFVHAGIEPAQFPNCPDETRIWTRSARFFDERLWPDRPELQGLLVVHGHTPTEDGKPDWWPRRLNIDTGAVFGGPLTCAVLAPGESPRFLRA